MAPARSNGAARGGSRVALVLGLLVAAVSVARFPHTAHAAQVHVNAATGDDATGTGAAGAPFQTLTAAWASVGNGDEVVLAAGRYWYDGDAPDYAPVLSLDRHVNITGAGAGATLLNDTRVEVVAAGGFTVSAVTIENTRAGVSPDAPVAMIAVRACALVSVCWSALRVGVRTAALLCGFRPTLRDGPVLAAAVAGATY